MFVISRAAADARVMRLVLFAGAFVAMFSLTAATAVQHSTHMQDYYCHNEFVGLIRVRREVPARSHKNTVYWAETRYKIRIKKIFKAMSNFSEAVDQDTLWTPPTNDVYCAVRLRPKVKYVITGNIINGKMYLSSCQGWYKPWLHLTSQQRKGFKHFYKRGCDCMIKVCPWRHSPYCKHSADKCSWSTAYGYDLLLPSSNSAAGYHYKRPVDCQLQYTSCNRLASTNGKCAWRPNKKYMKCMRDHRHRWRIIS